MPKILAVDDSATMRQVLQLTFRGVDGYELTAVDSMEAALQFATANPVDLVIADASMSPSGYDLCQRFRGHPRLAGVGVLLLASKHTPLDADRAKAVGVDDHAVKPFDTAALLEKVKALAARKPAAASAAASAPLAPAHPYREVATTAAPVAPARPAPAAPAPAAAAPKASPAAIPGVVQPTMARAPGPRMTAAFGAPIPASPVAPLATKAPALELEVDEAPKTAPPPVVQVVQAAPAAVAPSPGAKVSAELGTKLEGLGLTPQQLEAILVLSREIVERVVWEVVPDLAETLIREEIQRLTK